MCMMCSRRTGGRAGEGPTLFCAAPYTYIATTFTRVSCFMRVFSFKMRHVPFFSLCTQFGRVVFLSARRRAPNWRRRIYLLGESRNSLVKYFSCLRVCVCITYRHYLRWRRVLFITQAHKTETALRALTLACLPACSLLASGALVKKLKVHVRIKVGCARYGPRVRDVSRFLLRCTWPPPPAGLRIFCHAFAGVLKGETFYFEHISSQGPKVKPNFVCCMLSAPRGHAFKLLVLPGLN